MTDLGDVTHIKKCRKKRQCDWCNEWIEVGQSAVEYASVYGRDFFYTKLHPECFEAMQEVMFEWGDVEFSPGDFPRGKSEPKYVDYRGRNEL